MPIGTNKTPVVSIVSKMLWVPCHAYSMAGRSPAGVEGSV